VRYVEGNKRRAGETTSSEWETREHFATMAC